MAIIYLALPLLTESSDLPEDLRSEQPRFSSKTGKTISLFDLASGVVYHASVVTNEAVGSYPAFSPFPQLDTSSQGSLFSVALSVLSLKARALPVRKYDALCCPDFPLLSLRLKNDKPACINHKFTHLM